MKATSKHIVSFSGGKDSTAMLLMMLERGMQVDEIRTFDTGWEFPQMYEHWKKVEEYTGRKINVIHPKKSFYDWMINTEVVRSFGPNKGEVHRVGYGWPSVMRRWCTRQKINALNRGARRATRYIGMASDEPHRIKLDGNYPLATWGITEADALQYCYDRGFDWGGLYNHFDRVSCFCCPLQSLKNLRVLRQHYPSLWQQMLEWDRAIPLNEGDRGFKDLSVVALEDRFGREDEANKRQGKLFCDMSEVA